jgi:uncharacterized protein YcfJ
MRTMILSAAAAVAAFAAPALASAQNYGQVSQQCQQSVNNNRLGGGVVGAVAGAVVGKQIAGRNARTEGQVLGAVIGAVAGSELGRRRIACDDGAYRTQNAPRQGTYQPSGYGYGYDNDDRDYNHNRGRSHHVSYRPPAQHRQQCGWGEQSVRSPNGHYQTQNVWMCQARDGNWYPANR